MRNTTADQPDTVPETAVEAEEPSHAGLGRQLGMMLRTLRLSPVRQALTTLIAAIFLIIAVTAYGQIRLNRWNKPFYDALSRRDLRDFLFQLGVFFLIASFLLVLNVAQKWLVETLKVKLRDGLVRDLIQDWMRPRQAFWLANAGSIGINPDQRMHEDARKLCELSADLGAGLLQSTILFATFSGVLWELSNNLSFRIGHHDYAIPGFMVWAAIAYASAGSLMSYWVGRSLISRNAERYAREADLRFSLVRINEHLDGISLAAGETDEKRRLDLDLGSVLAATQRLVTGLTNLTWITSGFGWVTQVVPILVAAPLYFEGKITFGGLMMAAAAFTQAQSSLRWFVDNFSVIADWRATLLRVANFREALTTTQAQRSYKSGISYVEASPGTMTIDDLEIVSPLGAEMLKERQVVVSTGERVLIVGAPGTSKTLLFRALAGLWPWGAGRIGRPKDEQMAFLPRGTPYLPRGTLRDVLAYPLRVESFAEGSFAHALDRLGLERLVPMLDVSRRWDQVLSQDQQLCVAFARILLQAPAWILIDDTLGSLDDEVLERVLNVFSHELERTSIIHIGRTSQTRDPLFSRVLHLVKDPATPSLVPNGATTAGTATLPNDAGMARR